VPQLAYAAPEPVTYAASEPQPEPEYAEAAPPPPPLPPENVNRVPASSVTVKLPPARDVREVAPRQPAQVIRAAAAPKPAKLRRAAAPLQRAGALRRGNASAVVQLGAYGSPQRVLAAWNAAARRHHALRAYAPISARFVSPRGTVYRLAVKGFGSAGEASALCASLRRSGASCFVRNVAGDAPVQFAAR
jgi:hypothetical protein